MAVQKNTETRTSDIRHEQYSSTGKKKSVHKVGMAVQKNTETRIIGMIKNMMG